MQDSKQNRMAEEWKTVLEVGSTNRSATLEGLDPQTSYTFRIVPRLGFEIGNSSSVQILKPLGVYSWRNRGLGKGRGKGHSSAIAKIN